MDEITRRRFLGAAGATAFGLTAAAAGTAGSKGRVRPNLLYGLTTGSWHLVVPPGEPLPLVRILDETAASRFNGIRLTGFPRILEENDFDLDRLEDELAKRDLKFATISFGANYRDTSQQPEILASLRRVLEVHRRFGATAATFFPSAAVMPGENEKEVYDATFAFYRRMGKMALEEYGVRMGIHNLPGSLVSTQAQVDRYLENTDPRYVFCAWDTAQLLQEGCDVVGTFRRSIDRVIFVDFEDATRKPTTADFVAPNGQRFAGDSPRGRFYNSSLDLGRGDVDYPGIMRILKEAKYRGWIIPDLHAVRESALTSWKIAMDYIEGTLDPIYE